MSLLFNDGEQMRQSDLKISTDSSRNFPKNPKMFFLFLFSIGNRKGTITKGNVRGIPVNINFFDDGRFPLYSVYFSVQQLLFECFAFTFRLIRHEFYLIRNRSRLSCCDVLYLRRELEMERMLAVSLVILFRCFSKVLTQLLQIDSETCLTLSPS